MDAPINRVPTSHSLHEHTKEIVGILLKEPGLFLVNSVDRVLLCNLVWAV